MKRRQRVLQNPQFLVGPRNVRLRGDSGELHGFVLKSFVMGFSPQQWQRMPPTPNQSTTLTRPPNAVIVHFMAY